MILYPSPQLYSLTLFCTHSVAGAIWYTILLLGFSGKSLMWERWYGRSTIQDGWHSVCWKQAALAFLWVPGAAWNLISTTKCSNTLSVHKSLPGALGFHIYKSPQFAACLDFSQQFALKGGLLLKGCHFIIPVSMQSEITNGFTTDIRILLSVGLGLARCSSGGRLIAFLRA